VEKVVKPPQKPTMSSRENTGERFWKRLVRPHRMPINRQPTMFTENVPHGKPPYVCPMRSDIR
jgi:hypothetical protein